MRSLKPGAQFSLGMSMLVSAIWLPAYLLKDFGPIKDYWWSGPLVVSAVVGGIAGIIIALYGLSELLD